MSLPLPLYVDLDGSLTYADTFHEQCLRFLKSKPWAIACIPLWLFRGGRSYVKERVADASPIEPGSLPYNQAVLDLINSRKRDGGSIILATAASADTAKKIADHLGCFDRILASNSVTNLKGQNKLTEINHNDQKFAYLGNSSADLKIWEAASERYVVNASASLTSRVLAAEGTCIEMRPKVFNALIRAIRPLQWLKNLLLFAPLILAHRFLDPYAIFEAFLGFTAFSMCASSAYLLNDLMDIESDRKHIVKRNRPFARGQVPIPLGIAASFLMSFIGIALALILPLKFIGVLVAYIIISNAYSFRLKKVVMLDVAVLAGLYTMRILAGAEAIDVELSFWFLSFSMFLFLSLALVKRYCEILSVERAAGGLVTGRDYSSEDKWIIAQLGTSSGLISVLVMALYVNSPEVAQQYSDPRIIWLICPLLMYWIGRIWLLAHRGQVDEDPIIFAVKDRRTLYIGLVAAIVLLLAV